MIQIGTEIMSDWPIYAKTLKEILEELGCIEIDNGVFKISEELLNSYPVTLQDDGMGYGVNEMYLTLAEGTIYKSDIGNIFNLWRDANHTTKESGDLD